MDTAKQRILLCSPQAEFLSSFKTNLDKDFEIQVASSEEIALFLTKDWKPKIALVDGDNFGNLTTQFRQNFTYSNLGIVVIAQTEGIFKEEYAFRTGADHFLGNLTDYKQLVWRIISLVRKMQNVQLPSQANSQRGSDKAFFFIDIEFCVSNDNFGCHNIIKCSNFCFAFFSFSVSIF